jgi:hypothetical protein
MTVAVAALLATAAGAQDPQKLAAAQKQNKEALRSYTWKSRSEIKLKGESKNVKLDQVRYDLDGQTEKTPLAATPQAAAPAGGGGRGSRLKEKVVEKKTEDFKELMQGLGQLAASYGQIPPDKMQAFAQSATNGPGEGAMKGTVRIQGSKVLDAGDSLTVWLDPASLMMRRAEVQTVYDKEPASLVVEFQAVPDGPTYMARAVVDYPVKQLQMIVENYAYDRIGR